MENREQSVSNEELGYPSVRKALNEYREWINLRCIIKYPLWHLSYAVFTVLIGILMALMFVVAVPIVGSSAAWDKITGNPKVKAVIESETASTAVYYLTSAFMIGVLLVCLGAILYSFIFHFWTSVAIVVFVLLTLGAMALMLLIYDYYEKNYQRQFQAWKAKQFSSVRERKVVIESKQNQVESSTERIPVVRRIYGRCPISIDIRPKWFEAISSKF